MPNYSQEPSYIQKPNYIQEPSRKIEKMHILILRLAHMEEMLKHLTEMDIVILKLKDKVQDQELNLYCPNMLEYIIQ